jgi:RHS repeat-associated protein
MVNIGSVIPAATGSGQSRFGVLRLRGSQYGRMIIRPYPPEGGTPNKDSGGVTRTHVYTYDDSGNMVHDENYAYGYDPENRLVLVRKSGPYGTLDYETITKYVYDADHCIAEYNAYNQLKRKYIYGPGVDQPICMIDTMTSPAVTSYYHFDGLGSVVALTDDESDTVQVYEYDVYGRLGATDANHPNRIMFTGREYDKETGLYYYRARDYNPQIGRFLQTDPIGYRNGINWYRYCRNRPANWIDPPGLWTLALYWGQDVVEAGGNVTWSGKRAEVDLKGASADVSNLALWSCPIALMAHELSHAKDDPNHQTPVGAASQSRAIGVENATMLALFGWNPLEYYFEWWAGRTFRDPAKPDQPKWCISAIQVKDECMSRYKTVIWVCGLCASSLLNSAQSWGGQASEKSTGEVNVALTVGALRMMNRSVELRCEVRNNGRQDIWVYDDIRYDSNDVPHANAAVFLDKEGQTLVILRRINRPLHGISTAAVGGIYTRLRAGESRPYVLLVTLPVRVELHDLQGFEDAILKETEYLTCLAFQIGYYTSDDLRSLKPKVNSSFASIDFESPDRVRVEEDPRSSITFSERAATVEMKGVYIPYKQWIIRVDEDPLRRARQLSEKPAPPTPLEILRDLFYSFSLNVEQYRYARQLLAIDTDLLDDRATRLVNVYIRVAQGKLSPAELAQHLDEVMGRSDREKLLQELQEKQDARRRNSGDTGIPGTSMSKPLSRRSRDCFAGIPPIYSASSGSERQESTYEPVPVTFTRSCGLSPQERELGTTTVFLSTRGGSAR